MAHARRSSVALDSERWRHVGLSVAIEDPLDRSRDGRSESWRYRQPRCSGRRAWETYRDDVLPRVQLLRSVINKYVVERLRVLQLAAAFRQWTRQSRIQTAQSAYHSLVLQHRTYYLRKALLRRWWDTLARRRFAQWRAFTAQSQRALLALLESYERQRARLALAKWYHRVVRVERLEEEAFASVLVRQQRQQDQAVVRKLQRRDRLLLVLVWVHWRARTRSWACRRAPRRLRFQMRSIFVHWTRFAVARRRERAQRWESVRALVQDIGHKAIDVAHSKMLAQQTSSTRAAMLAIEQLVSKHQRRVALRACFRRWQSTAPPAAKTHDASDSPRQQQRQRQQQQRGAHQNLGAMSLAKFDRLQRFSKKHQAPPTRAASYRPHWR